MINTRYSGIFDITQDVTLIGAGGIGSLTAITLAKMGIELKIFDFDEVAIENVGTQFYDDEDLTFPKSFVLADKCAASGGKVSSYEKKVTSDTPTDLLFSDIVISAVDSLEARQDIWPAVKKTGSFYIDARMGAELFTMYTVPYERYERYETFLYSKNPGDIPPVPCTEKATIYTANFAAGWIATAIRKFTSNQPTYYMLTHDIMNMSIKTME